MKNIILIFIAILLGFNPLVAQKLKWTGVTKKARNARRRLVVPVNDDFFLTYEPSQTGKSYLVKYDAKNAKEVKRLQYKGLRKKKNLHFVGFISIGHQAYILTRLLNKKKKKNYLFAQRIDIQTLALSPHQILLEKEWHRELNIFMNEKSTDLFQFALSPDKSKILFYYLKKVKFREKVKLNVAIYNQNLELEWKRKIALPTQRKYTLVEKLIVDNNGSVFFKSREYKNNKGRDNYKGKVNYNIKIYGFTNKGNDKAHYTLKQKNVNLSTKHIIWSTKPGIINFLGLYGPLPKNIRFGWDFERYQGYFHEQIDFNTQIISPPKKHTFPNDFPNENISLSIDSVIYNPNTGNSTLIMEDAGTYISEGGIRRTNYFNKDIICLQLNEDGEMNWHHIIHKRQDNKSPKFQSYAFFSTNDNTYIYFNDRKYNKKRRQEKKKVKKYKSRLKKNNGVFLVTIDKHGNQKEKIISTETIQILPSEMGLISKKRGVIFAKTKGNTKIGIITLP